MKGEETREKILETALELFRERGYAETSMREIAAKAGVATGLAYYYFASKDAIVLAFYDRANRELGPLLEETQKGKKLDARLQAMIETKCRYFEPNRKFLGALMGHAANPSSPLSPFGEPSRAIRETEFAHFQRALDETGTRIADDLKPHMAKILWMYQMGLILFWMYDDSKKQKRTERLLQSSLRMVVALIKLGNLPLMKPARSAVLELVEILES